MLVRLAPEITLQCDPSHHEGKGKSNSQPGEVNERVAVPGRMRAEIREEGGLLLSQSNEIVDEGGYDLQLLYRI